LPTGPRGGFIPNQHPATGGYHPLLRQAASQANFAALSSAQQLQFLQQFNTAFSQSLLTGMSRPLLKVGAWAGLQVHDFVGAH